jgi:hypothetical protein
LWLDRKSSAVKKSFGNYLLASPATPAHLRFLGLSLPILIDLLNLVVFDISSNSLSFRSIPFDNNSNTVALNNVTMTTALTRLHISPLDPALLDSILGPTNRPLATNISFHTIPTFPENSFGYVSLPSMEADKLKRKLNGSILKGKKFKVEAARPDPKETKQPSESPDTDKKEEKKKKKSSKRKAEEEQENGVLEGHELPAGRQVKRGWTEPASSRKHKKQKKSEKEAKPAKLQSKSKYTEKAECLFKTKTPPNKTVTGKKDKKSKNDKAPNEVLVHEFAQTVTHPSFLKSTTQDQPVTAGFEEGKGWVDMDGTIKEAASEKSKKATFNPGKRDGAKERVSKKSKLDRHSKKKEKPSTPVSSPSESEEQPDWTSSSGSSDDDSSASESDTSDESSDVSSDDESSASNEEERVTKAKPESLTKPAHGDKPKSVNGDEPESGGGSNKEDSSKDSHSTSDKATSDEDSSEDSSSSSEDEKEESETNNVHPLEALFKRKEQQPEETNTGFSFFGGNDDDIEDEEEDEVQQPTSTEPLTPYTRRDRLVRHVRSAAPTPDTAVRSHTKLLADEDEDMEDLDDEPHTESSPSKARDQSVAQQPQETDFAKWFWENRGDNNRAWKKRRRDSAKEKRQRDNRRKGMKGRG